MAERFKATHGLSRRKRNSFDTWRLPMDMIQNGASDGPSFRVPFVSFGALLFSARFDAARFSEGNEPGTAI